MMEKKITDVKRHFLVDVLGLLICIVVYAASIVDRAGAKLVLEKMDRPRLSLLKKVLTGGYTGEKTCVEAAKHGLKWEVVKRSELHRFAVVPKRWVERSISWTMNWQSLCR